MTKRELKAQIDNLESRATILTNKISSLAGTVSSYQSKVDKQQNDDKFSQINKTLNKLEKEQDDRWEILKEYLGVKEDEYAELENKTSHHFSLFEPFNRFMESEPVKKIRLVKVKKSKK